MNWRDLPNPSEPADSQRRVEAILRVHRRVEDAKELAEEDKAEFLRCIYALPHGYLCLGSASSVKALEVAGRRGMVK